MSISHCSNLGQNNVNISHIELHNPVLLSAKRGPFPRWGDSKINTLSRSPRPIAEKHNFKRPSKAMDPPHCREFPIPQSLRSRFSLVAHFFGGLRIRKSCASPFSRSTMFFSRSRSHFEGSLRGERTGFSGTAARFSKKTIKSAMSPRRRLSNVSFTPISGTIEQFKIAPQGTVALMPKSFPFSL